MQLKTCGLKGIKFLTSPQNGLFDDKKLSEKKKFAIGIEVQITCIRILVLVLTFGVEFFLEPYVFLSGGFMTELFENVHKKPVSFSSLK